MVFSVSPSVTVKEVDLTTTIPAITTPPAAIAGVFHWGPVNERVLISSEVELVNTFGKPSDFNAETFFTAADFLSYSNALYVVRVVSDDAEKAAVYDSSNNELFAAKYFGEYGNNLDVSYVITDASGNTHSFSTSVFSTGVSNIKGADGDAIEDVTEVASNTMVFNTSTLFVVTESADEDIEEGDILRIGTTSSGFQDMVVSSVSTTTEIVGETTIYTYKVTFANKYSLPVFNTSLLTFTRLWKYAGIVNDAPAAGSFHLIVTDRTGEISGLSGAVIEKYENLSANTAAKSADGTSLYYKNRLEVSSAYIEGSSTYTLNTSAVGRFYGSLSGGADGENEASASLFGAIAQGYDLFKEANDVDVSFILQGKAVSSNLSNYLIANISDYRKDCMTFISPRKEDVVGVSSQQTQLDNVIAFRGSLQNSSYWVMDSGYKYRYDKYNDVYRWVPLNGDIAGLASRVEPWESPAGYRKGQVKNVVKLAFNPNKAYRDLLYGKDVNPVITQVGQGTILFGDKTGLGTATGSAFTRINVRRLFITVEKAIATISASFLFEFNDEFTQNQFRNVVNPFLRDIQGRRGIIDYRVVSDSTINTPDIIDRNIFRSNIFIKPARSINFIELTFVATRTGVEFEEIVGQQF